MLPHAAFGHCTPCVGACMHACANVCLALAHACMHVPMPSVSTRTSGEPLPVPYLWPPCRGCQAAAWTLHPPWWRHGRRWGHQARAERNAGCRRAALHAKRTLHQDPEVCHARCSPSQNRNTDNVATCMQSVFLVKLQSLRKPAQKEACLPITLQWRVATWDLCSIHSRTGDAEGPEV